LLDYGQYETFSIGEESALLTVCSFTLMISRDKIRELLVRMGRLGISRDDLEESFIRGSGHGGQKVNKTSSTVRLRHVPTGVEVRCQEERSLSQNRYLARQELCEKIETRLTAARQRTQAAIAKKRRQEQKRSRASKAQLTREKRHRSRTKAMRRPPAGED
jgi:protein subunit release factor B